MGKNLERLFSFRCDEVTIKKISYISEFYERNRNQEIKYLIKKEIARFEDEHGKIPIEK